MQTPVISGNVSFYNESELGEVPPTPLIGMLGIIEDAEKRIGLAPMGGSGKVALLATPLENVVQEGFGASEYLAEVHGIEDGRPVAPNLRAERVLCELLADAANAGWIGSAHDLSEGGLAVAAAEIAIVGDVGLTLELGSLFDYSSRTDAKLFGELPGRVLVCIPEGSDAQALQEAAAGKGLQFAVVGSYEASQQSLRIGSVLNVEIGELRAAYEGAIPAIMLEQA
jgi:phosphoribosylformylglycinamidine synthase